MRALVLLLGLATLGLAITSGYLYRELERERSLDPMSTLSSREDSSPAMPENSGAAFEPEAGSSAFDEEDEEPLARAQPSVQDAPEDPATVRANRLAERRTQLQQRWADPSFRARALAQAKLQVRRQSPDIGSALKLSASQESAFLDLLANQRMQVEEVNARMRLASEAERASIQQERAALELQHDQERAQQLGARYQDYDRYQQQVPERQQLRELRSRLDESSALTDSQASRLVDAMYQERDSYLQQLTSVENAPAHSSQYPFVAFPRGLDPAERLRFAEEQLARTEEFQGRLRNRASSVLSGEQLRRFDEVQEEQLAIAQSVVERVRNRGNRPNRGRRAQAR